jgi:hypothetical protein
MEHEFVIQDIDLVMYGLKTGVPSAVAESMSKRLVQMAEHFYTVAELLELPDKEVEALAAQLSTALLNKQVKDAWYSGKGRVFIRGPELWSVYLPSEYNNSRQAIYKPDEVPTEWRRQLGMLQLLNNSRTLLKDCGYRHNDKVFYLMEDGHGA